ncbi:MAG: enoyl-CoA hydratase [Burkholderiaceae bacterium]
MTVGRIGFDLQDGIATLTVENEARRNAMSFAMWQQLARHLETIDADPAVRVTVLRGQGEQAFVSGADISEFDALRSAPDAVAQYDLAVERAQRALQRLRCPVIAAISGICYGGGIGLALSCDLRYAAPGARFRMPAARLGLGYALDGLRRMSAVMGVAAASELFYTARVYDAGQAERLGLVLSVHPDVFAWAAGVARDIAANAPLTLAAAKLAFDTVLNQPLQGCERVDAAVERCFASEDYAEGRRAFGEKRTPRFLGR